MKKKTFTYLFSVNITFCELVMIKTALAATKVNFRTETINFKRDLLQRLCLLWSLGISRHNSPEQRGLYFKLRLDSNVRNYTFTFWTHWERQKKKKNEQGINIKSVCQEECAQAHLTVNSCTLLPDITSVLLGQGAAIYSTPFWLRHYCVY